MAKAQKRFRSGTLVRWVHRSGGSRKDVYYGIVRRLNRTKYTTRCVHGANRKYVGIDWSVHPRHLTAIPPSRIPDEVLKAIAHSALTGKVRKHD